jgi:hypothetical protein
MAKILRFLRNHKATIYQVWLLIICTAMIVLTILNALKINGYM